MRRPGEKQRRTPSAGRPTHARSLATSKRLGQRPDARLGRTEASAGTRSVHSSLLDLATSERLRPRRRDCRTGRNAAATTERSGLPRSCCFLFDRWGAVKSSCRCSLVVRWGSFLFRRSGPRRLFVGAVSASQFHAGPSGGQKAAGACRGGVGPAWRGGLEWLLARQDVPGGDQDLAGDGGLGGVLAGAFGDVGVELVPGVGGSPGVWGGFDGGPAQCPRSRL